MTSLILPDSEVIQVRAALEQRLRDFFARAQIAVAATPEGAIRHRWQAMQPLLAEAGQPSYQLATCRHDGVIDRWHADAYTALIWCQADWSIAQAIAGLEDLLSAAFGAETRCEKRSLREAFIARLAFDPALQSIAMLRQQASRLGLRIALPESRDVWLAYLLDQMIKPTLGLEEPLILTHMDEGETHPHLGRTVAQLYIDGIRIAKIIQHVDPTQETRQTCSILLGVDRLLMFLLDTRRIDQVRS